MATIIGTSGNNSWTIIDPGTFTIDGLEGVDTIDFGTSLRSEYLITQGPGGVVLVDSVSSASGQLHAKLTSIELLQFNSRRDTLDLRTFFGDTTAPTVSLGDNVSGVARSTIVFTLAFSEVVTGLAADDVTVTHGSVQVVSGSGQNYSVTVLPESNFEGTMLLTLRAAAVIDATGNALAASASTSQAIDTRAPTFTAGNPLDGSTGVATSTSLALNFSEAIAKGTGVVRLKDGAGVIVASWDMARVDQGTATGSTLNLALATALPAGTGLSFELPAGAVKDLAGNAYASPALADNILLSFITAPDGSGNLRGTLRADTLAGAKSNEALSGLGGNDTLLGSPGNDTLDGGAGFDRADYTSATNPVIASLGDGAPGTALDGMGGIPSMISGDIPLDGTDTLIGIEALLGGSAADSLTGGAAVYELFSGRAGNDTIDGGAGIDVADYRDGGTLPINANLLTGVVIDNFGNSDSLVRIEAVFGGPLADTLRGSDGVASGRDNTLRGGGGNDTIDGGSGVDTAEWLGHRADYTVTRINASTWTVRDNNLANGNEGTDTVTNVERLIFADQQLSFGARAEELARVAFVLWSPAIVASTALFGRGYSYYDVGYSFEQMSEVALQFWPQQGSAFADMLVRNSPGTTRTAAELLTVMANAGGGDAGRAAAVRTMALDPATTSAIVASGVLDHGVVSDNTVPDFGTLFLLLPVG